MALPPRQVSFCCYGRGIRQDVDDANYKQRPQKNNFGILRIADV
jgi:hypothetical protein